MTTIYDMMTWEADGSIDIRSKMPDYSNRKRHKKNVNERRAKAKKAAKKA